MVALVKMMVHGIRINQREQAIKNYNPVRTLEHQKLIKNVRGQYRFTFYNCKTSSGTLKQCLDEEWETYDECYSDLFNSDYFWNK